MYFCGKKIKNKKIEWKSTFTQNNVNMYIKDYILSLVSMTIQMFTLYILNMHIFAVGYHTQRNNLKNNKKKNIWI
jgi:hypothetical protein